MINWSMVVSVPTICCACTCSNEVDIAAPPEPNVYSRSPAARPIYLVAAGGRARGSSVNLGSAGGWRGSVRGDRVGGPSGGPAPNRLKLSYGPNRVPASSGMGGENRRILRRHRGIVPNEMEREGRGAEEVRERGASV